MNLDTRPASAGVKAGMSPLPGGRYVIAYGMRVPVAVRLACKLLYVSLLLLYICQGSKKTLLSPEQFVSISHR